MSDGIAWRFDTVAYPAADERSLQAMLLHPSSSLLARPGRRPGPGLEVTIGGTPEAANVAAGGGVIRDADGGTYVFVIPTPVALTLAARPSVGNSRISYVLARIKDEDVRPGDTLREPDIYLLEGTAGASPTPPTIPAGHLQLARLDIPASGTIAVSGSAQRMAAAGGLIVVATSTERDAIEQPYDGLLVYREDNKSLEGRINGAWVPVAYDSGWIAITKAAVMTSGTLRYRVKNGYVTVQVSGAANTASGTEITLTGAALPTAYRPSVAVMGFGDFGGAPGRLLLATSGHITAFQISGASHTTVAGVLVYPVE